MKRIHKKIFLKIRRLIRMVTLGNRSLRVKIILCYFLVIIPTLIVGNNYYTNYSRISLENSLNSVSQIDRQINDKIDGLIKGAESFTILFQHIDYLNDLFFGKDYNEQNNDNINQSGIFKEFEQREGSIFFFNENFFSLDVYTAERALVYSITKDGFQYNVSDPYRDWFKKTLELKGLGFIVKPFLNLKSNIKQTCFSYSRAILKKESLNEIAGIVSLNIDMKVISQMFGSVDFGVGSNIIILDSDKNVVFSKVKDNLKYNVDDGLLLKLDAEGRRKYSLNGTEYYINYYTSSITGWKIISIVPIDYIYKQLLPVKNFTILMITLCVFIGLVITVLISYSITSPLKKLTKVIAATDPTTLPNRLNIRYKDEIGQMGRGFNRMVRKINNLINSVYLAQINEKQTKMDALQIQINPHFLYNTLETIRMLAEINDDSDVAKISETLGRLLRYGVDIFNTQATMKDELEHLKNYIFIQNYRFSNKFEVNIDVNDEILNMPVIKLIIQPIVENAIYYGLEGKNGKSCINIYGIRQDNSIIISIMDNGRGMDEGTLERVKRGIYSDEKQELTKGKKRSIGLRNVNERIKLKYGVQYGLELESTENIGTCVKINLPVFNQKEGGTV